MDIRGHFLCVAIPRPCPFFDARPTDEISLLVIHGISLPAGVFGAPWVDCLFTGQWPESIPEELQDVRALRVSTHLFIRRDGTIFQYVPFDKRAWHAGKSHYQGRDACNDFSIGIELEGTDAIPYTDVQYQQLAEVTKALLRTYPAITLERIVGHSDIAPGRKTDPGVAFDWQRYCKMCL